MYTPTLAPSREEPRGARHVELAAGRDPGVDLVLPTVSMAQVFGTVLTASGQPPGDGVTVPVAIGTPTRSPPTCGPCARGPTAPSAPGPAAGWVHPVGAGASGGPGTGMEWGRTRVSVTGGGLADIVIRTQRGAAVSGQVAFDGVSSPPTGTMSITVAPSEDFWPLYTPPIDVTPRRRRLHIQAAVRRVRLGVEGVPSGWMLEGLYVNDRNVLGTRSRFVGARQSPAQGRPHQARHLRPRHGADRGRPPGKRRLHRRLPGRAAPGAGSRLGFPSSGAPPRRDDRDLRRVAAGGLLRVRRESACLLQGVRRGRARTPARYRHEVLPA